jgi:arylsulfatase A-like enzyme
MTIDVLPTLASILHASLPSLEIDGRDLGPLLRVEANAQSPHDALYFWYHSGDLEAMRSGKWKLHFPHSYRSMHGQKPGHDGTPGKYDYGQKIALSLFNLKEDIEEKTDLSTQRPEVVQALTDMANAMRIRLGDRLTKVVGKDCRAAGH